MSDICKGYVTSRSSREQEPYHWYGQSLHQCKICQILMAASISFYVPWSCTREGQGVPSCLFQKKETPEIAHVKARWTLKVATLKGDPSIPGIVALSLYYSKPFYFMSNACKVVKWNKMTRKVWSKETNRMVKTPFFRLNLIHD